MGARENLVCCTETCRVTRIFSIEGFMKGRDVFIVLPTGFGNTLCYACLPVAFHICLQ